MDTDTESSQHNHQQAAVRPSNTTLTTHHQQSNTWNNWLLHTPHCLHKIPIKAAHRKPNFIELYLSWESTERISTGGGPCQDIWWVFFSLSKNYNWKYGGVVEYLYETSVCGYLK